MPISAEIISNTRSEYSISRLNKNNLADVAKLHTAVYGTVVDHLPKKYDTAYTGVEDVGFIAYNKENLPVAYYGVIPCFIEYGNMIILVAQSADTMTDPQHRYKGLFVELSNMTFDLCRELGILLIFGFPNQNSYPAMIKHLGWIETEKMNRFTITVNTILGMSLFQGREKSHGRILSKLLLPEKGLRNSIVEDGYAGIYRDEAYYQYKTFEKTYVISLGVVDLWIKTGKELVIGDIRLTEKNSEYFFDQVKALAKKLNLGKISFQVCSGSRLHDLFASHYEGIPSFPVLFKDFGSGLPLEKIKFTFSDIDIF